MKPLRHRLDRLCKIQSGGTPSRKTASFYGGDIPWAKIGDLDVSDGVVRETEESITKEGLEAIRHRTFEPGTILLAMYGSVGKTATAGVTLSTNQAILGINVRKPDKLESRYLLRWLEHIQPQLIHGARGVTQKNISATLVRALEIPLLPVGEQRRIADILDRVDAIRRKRRAAIALTEELLRSTFLDLIGDPVSNPRGWPTASLGMLITDGPNNGLYRPAKDYGSGTPIVRIDSFYDGVVTGLGSLKRVRIPDDQIERYRLMADDILINRVNSPKYLGKSAVVPALREATVYESNMMRLRVDAERADPVFVVTQMQDQWVRAQIARQSRDAVNQSSINQTDVRSFRLRVPPIALQREFRSRTDEIRRLIDRLEKAADEADTLFHALTQRAFRGAL